MRKLWVFIVLGIVIPSFGVFYGTRDGAGISLFGFFNTISLYGIKLAGYVKSDFGLLIWDPLVLTDPNGALDFPLVISKSQSFGLDNTKILFSSVIGYLFLISYIILFAGIILYKITSKSQSTKLQSTNTDFNSISQSQNKNNNTSLRYDLFDTPRLILFVTLISTVVIQSTISNIYELKDSISLPFGTLLLAIAIFLTFDLQDSKIDPKYHLILKVLFFFLLFVISFFLALVLKN